MFLSVQFVCQFVHLTEIDFPPALSYNVLNKIYINLKRLLSIQLQSSPCKPYWKLSKPKQYTIKIHKFEIEIFKIKLLLRPRIS